MFDYEVIVVGGGPAGSTAAYQLRKYGFNVLLLDKNIFPRSKLCAGLLTRKTMRVLQENFGLGIADLKKDNIIDYSSNYYKIFYKNKLVYEQQMSNSFNYIYRSVYDNYLLQKAKELGVEVREGTKVTNIDITKNIIITQDGQKISGKYIVTADGANSIIREKLFKIRGEKVRRNFKKNMATTIETIIPREEFKRQVDYPLIYYGVINWGYGWVFPKKDNIVIGIGGLKDRNRNFHDIFRDYLKLLNVDITKIEYSGWSLPYGNYLAKASYKKLFLVGDAAGLAEPVTGEGIYYAHKSALLAARTIKEVENNPHIDAEKYYQQLLTTTIIQRLDKFKKLRSFLCNRSLFLQKPIFSVGIKVLGRKLTKMIQG